MQNLRNVRNDRDFREMSPSSSTTNLTHHCMKKLDETISMTTSHLLLLGLLLLPMMAVSQRRNLSDIQNVVGCEDLDCQNGGYCEILTLAKHHSTLPQRCICQPGFGGLECEIETSVCYNIYSEDRYCQAGAPCLVKDGRDYCDCTQGYDLSAFAGLECEFSATEYCTEDGSLSKVAFCVNGGDCEKYLSDQDEKVHPGCECKRGFEGDHCEYLTGQEPDKIAEVEPYSGSGHKVFHGFLISLFAVAILVLVFLIYRWYKRRYGARAQPDFDTEYVG